jgi:hypothetical protein
LTIICRARDDPHALEHQGVDVDHAVFLQPDLQTHSSGTRTKPQGLNALLLSAVLILRTGRIACGGIAALGLIAEIFRRHVNILIFDKAAGVASLCGTGASSSGGLGGGIGGSGSLTAFAKGAARELASKTAPLRRHRPANSPLEADCNRHLRPVETAT